MVGEVIVPTALITGGITTVSTGVAMIVAGELVAGVAVVATGFGIALIGIYLLSKGIQANVVKAMKA